MEFGNLEFDWDIDSKNIWDFSPQNLKLLENSLLAEVFGFEDTPDHFEHNHIQIEHDYFNRHFCEDTTNEVMTGQYNFSSVKNVMQPKKEPADYKTLFKGQRTLLKSKCDDDRSHISKSEQKSLKKFVRKMKNRVRRKIILFSLQILIFQVSAQESRKKKKEYLDSLEYNKTKSKVFSLEKLYPLS